MILTNGSVMFKRVKLSVLSNAPLCALPKNPSGKYATARDRELDVTLSSLAVCFFILHIYNPSCAVLLLKKNKTTKQNMCAHCLHHIHIFIHSYIL